MSGYIRPAVYDGSLGRNGRRGDGWAAMVQPVNPGDAAVTLTPGQLSTGLIAAITLTGARAYTLPLAVDMAAAFPQMDIGDSMMVLIYAVGNTITMTTNTGWTVAGTATIATTVSRWFRIEKTAAAAFTLTGM